MAADNERLDAALRQPPPVLQPATTAGIIDDRGRFRELFCAATMRNQGKFPDQRACEDALVRVGSEVAGSGAPIPGLAPGRLTTVVFVPGIFGECVEEIATPFSDAHDHLRRAGFRVIAVSTSGRSSSALNANLIDAQLREQLRDAEQVVVIAYSKGVSDFLEAMIKHSGSSWLKQVKAFVSVAGVVSGTPIADTMEQLYAVLASRLPWITCAPGDRGAVESLTRRHRLNWLATNALPGSIQYFSIAAIPASVPSNPAFAPFSFQLGSIDARHDGQVLIQDAMLPRSRLLGFANADHWAIALPFNRSSRLDAHFLSLGNAYPREVLSEAILLYVEEVLARPR